jgi:hypothetical protein
MNTKNIIHVSITLVIVLMLIFTGPASAVKIEISTPSGQYYGDEPVTFKVDILFKTNDLIPIDTINVTGLPKGDLSFQPDGTIISGDAGYNVTITSSAFYGYGYGYGYDQNPGYGYGYGYDFGYGYGYGYGYEYGYDYDYGYERGSWKSKLSYEIEVNGLTTGMYSDTVNIYVVTGNAKKPSFTSSEGYSFEIIPRPTDTTETKRHPNRLPSITTPATAGGSGELPEIDSEFETRLFDEGETEDIESGSSGEEKTPGFEIALGVLGILIAIYARRN